MGPRRGDIVCMLQLRGYIVARHERLERRRTELCAERRQ